MRSYKIFLAIMLSALAVSVLAGCAPAVSFPSLRMPDKPKTVYTWEERQISNPVALTSKNGKEYVAYQTDKQLVAHLDSTPRKVGTFERIGNFIAGLGFWIVIALVAAFIIAPAGTMLWLYQQKERFKNAMTQTVTAIKESNVLKENENLKTALADNHTEGTKKIVSAIKAKL